MSLMVREYMSVCVFVCVFVCVCTTDSSGSEFDGA